MLLAIRYATSGSPPLVTKIMNRFGLHVRALSRLISLLSRGRSIGALNIRMSASLAATIRRIIAVASVDQAISSQFFRPAIIPQHHQPGRALPHYRSFGLFTHRALAALVAISIRFLAVRLSALFFPPILPPLRPSSAITRLISSSDGGGGAIIGPGSSVLSRTIC